MDGIKWYAWRWKSLVSVLGASLHSTRPDRGVVQRYTLLHIVDTPIREAMSYSYHRGLQQESEFDGRHYIDTRIGTSQSSGTSSGVLET
jgi:hypothetical protein